METLAAIEARHEREMEDLKEKIKEMLKAAPKKGNARGEAETRAIQMEYALKAKHIEEIDEFEERGGDEAVLAAAAGEVEVVVEAKVEKSKEEIEAERQAAEEAERLRQEAIIQAKRDKNKKKKDKKASKEQEREQEKAELRAMAGPGGRAIEIAHMSKLLAPLGLKIKDIPADGNCLYRAVVSELQRIGQSAAVSVHSFEELRVVTGRYLLAHQEDFAPFLEMDAGSVEYENYCKAVMSPTAAEWGGQVELRAISNALNLEINVYRVGNPVLVIEPEVEGNSNSSSSNSNSNSSESGSSRSIGSISLTYHEHYYALGEHYNAVTPL